MTYPLPNPWVDGEELDAPTMYARTTAQINALAAAATIGGNVRYQAHNTTTVTISAGSFGTITGWSAEINTLGLTVASGVFTFPAGSAGPYELSANLTITGLGGGGQVFGYAFFQNGTRLYYGESGVASANTESYVLPPMEFTFADGDTLELKVDMITGSSGPATYIATVDLSTRIRVRNCA